MYEFIGKIILWGARHKYLWSIVTIIPIWAMLVAATNVIDILLLVVMFVYAYMLREIDEIIKEARRLMDSPAYRKTDS